MKFQIKNRFSGDVQFECDLEARYEQESYGIQLGAAVKLAVKAHANLAGASLADAYLADACLAGASLADAYLADACLAGANLADANLADACLAGASLAGANLADANLAGAYLADADLADADLAGANLAGANLAGAEGITAERVQPLMMLFDQPGKIRAYKLVNADDEGIYNGGLKYPVGATLEVSDANTDPNVQCGSGINVATLDWCLREYSEGLRIRIVEFEAKDIACIPIASDGKFRLHRCTVVGEKEVA